MLQVTLFSLAATCLYGIAVRLRLGGGSAVLIASLAAVGLLTIFCISPWPRWTLKQRDANAGGIIVVTDDSRVITGSGLRDFEWEPGANQSSLGQNPATVRATADALFANKSVSGSGQPDPWRLPRWTTVLAIVAGIAAAVGLLRFVIGAFYMWRYCRRSRSIDDQAAHDLLDALTRKLAITRQVAIRESDLLNVAATSGWRRPIVLLPAPWRTWTPNELRAVLAHEFAHISQRHFSVWALAQLPLIAHYYHPLVHWLVRRLRLEQELAADELAACLLGGRRQYATVLAGLALGTPPPRGDFAPLGLFMSRPFLLRRISMLHQTTTAGRSSRKWYSFVLLLLAITGAGVAGLRQSWAQDSEETASAETPETSDAALSTSAVPSSPASEQTTEGEHSAVLGMPGRWVSPHEEHRGPGATALFEISRTPPSVAGSAQQTESDVEWEFLCKTHLAKLRSYFVLIAALRPRDIASLPLVRAQDDPVEWLAQRLEVGFIPGSEIMYIRLSGKPDEVEQLTKLVDAVARAYEDEVVYVDSQSRLATRDLLAQSLKALKDELMKKTEMCHAIAREQRKLDSDSGRVAQEIDLKRLDRIETELMRLENAQLELQTSGQTGNSKFYSQRIDQLNKRRNELEEAIMARSETSIEVTSRLREIEQLQKLVNEMSMKLNILDIDQNAPSRIRKIQNAMPTGVGKAARGGDGAEVVNPAIDESRKSPNPLHPFKPAPDSNFAQ
jgi:beta-lactamase regulating signal transducer with metallopeptidase domain